MIDAAEDLVKFLKRKEIPHAIGFISTLNGKRSGGIISLKSSVINAETIKLEVVGNFYKQTITVYAPATDFLKQLEEMVQRFRGAYQLKIAEN